jgi:hypothetical protein
MKTRSVSTVLALGLLIAGLTGCTTPPKIMSEFDPAADFTAAKTFSIRPMPKTIENVDPGMLLRVGPAAMEAARNSLVGKGYTEVSDPATADIVVVIHGKVVPKTDITDWGFTPYYGAGYGWAGGYAYGGSNVTVDQYNEGTLSVEVYDAKTRNMIWVGWVTARATTKTEEQAANVGAGVTNILANYPAPGMKPVKPVTTK